MQTKIFLISIFWVLIALAPVMGASRYWVGGGSSANWNATGPTNWSATSGGSNNASVPGSTDDAIFDGAGASGNTNSTISASISLLSLTYTSGYTSNVTLNGVVTIVTGGSFTDNSAHTYSGASAMTFVGTITITQGGRSFPNGWNFSTTSGVKTFVGNAVIGGTLTSNVGGNTFNATTSETFSVAGISAVSSYNAGTLKFILTGGTWSSSQSIKNDLDLAGNVTISGTVSFDSKTMTYVSGTITTTSSTLQLTAGSTTLNCSGMSFNNITITNGGTYTFSSTCRVTGTFSISSGLSPTLAGSGGLDVNTFSTAHTGAGTVTLTNGVTYRVRTALTCNTSRIGAILAFTSDHGTNTATLTLDKGATCNVLANFTRIDASGGRTIRTFNGTVTSCSNIVAFNDLPVAKF